MFIQNNELTIYPHLAQIVFVITSKEILCNVKITFFCCFIHIEETIKNSYQIKVLFIDFLTPDYNY